MTDDSGTDDTPSDALRALADAHGIATSYWSFFGEHVVVPATTLRAVLTAMGVDAEADPDQALAEMTDAEWRRLLPPSLVVRQGWGEVVVNVQDGHDARLELHLEDGSWRDVGIPDQQAQAHVVDGEIVWRLHVPVPQDVPLGWHELYAQQIPHGAEGADRTATSMLVVTPHRLAAPASRPGNGGRAWGLVRSSLGDRAAAERTAERLEAAGWITTTVEHAEPLERAWERLLALGGAS